MEVNYNCFCDCFASNGFGVAIVYYDGKFCDYYREGALYDHTILTKKQYDDAFEFVKALNEDGGY